MSVKFQVTLPDDLSSDMKSTAARLRIPLAQFIRETMQDRLRELKAGRKGEPPFEWMKKLRVDIPDTDLASRVDEILYK
jgi:hypothetical protein